LNEDVVWFDVSVNDVSFVKIFQCQGTLVQNGGRLVVGKWPIGKVAVLVLEVSKWHIF
jgi:hypothetical protein